jgi:N-methylhydantoinase A
MDVVSLGLAGGSIISVDSRTGTPHIGPQSAGSYPGPICYGHGGEEPTITDVDGILGYLNPDYFLGGREKLDPTLAEERFASQVAEPLGLPLMDAAAAIYKLANSLFFDLLHKTTVQRGLDPRTFSLFSFGGTAGMHVAAYGEELGVSKIVVPHSASVHGAFGLITSDIAHEDQITRPMHAPVSVEDVRTLFEELEERMTAQLAEEGFGGERLSLRRSIDMRYRRQVHILTVPVLDDGPITEQSLERTVELFERLYEEKYGKESAYREAGIELVSFRLRGSGHVQKPDFRVEGPGDPDASHAIVKRVQAWVDKAGAVQELKGYDFEAMRPGNTVEGPAVIWSPITTLVIAPGQAARVDEYKNLVVSMSADPDRMRADRQARVQVSAA